MCFEHTRQLGVEPLAALRPKGYDKPPQHPRNEYRYGSRSHKVQSSDHGTQDANDMPQDCCLHGAPTD